jgi:hypothetical protein
MDDNEEMQRLVGRLAEGDKKEASPGCPGRRRRTQQAGWSVTRQSHALPGKPFRYPTQSWRQRSHHPTGRYPLRAVYESIRQAVGQSDWGVPDETGWRVGGHPAWLHALVSPQATA